MPTNSVKRGRMTHRHLSSLFLRSEMNFTGEATLSGLKGFSSPSNADRLAKAIYKQCLDGARFANSSPTSISAKRVARAPV